jgi:Fe-S cluster biogenesis protein NfuA
MEDSGDIKFVSVSSDGIVEIRFLGECAGCSMSLLTLQAGIQKTIMHAMPEVRRVNAV